ncbi:glycosyltransferase family 4 protein [Vibrio methylphosphonaticus]|uniref:glycosyltransferase family 4 protein n=1 Tax=Vibrio methylphosphonaticus TaxID=2946866 RepID=UPI00202A8343|nr:glycosyltransferase family 4 protein [Vibrio methylphosphonaticus]MCL9775472.1 glycosyltransferase family 4 protein [Vibrio methylphosphonaticus]
MEEISMRLVFVIDDYMPDSTRVGAKMFHELACYYLSIGHQVTVITPSANIREKIEFLEVDGVKVWRYKSGLIKSNSKFKRAINESLLSFRAWYSVSEYIGRDSFDAVVYYSPSIFLGGLVSKIKKRCECKAYLVLRDQFPQWAIDVGILKKGSVIERYFRVFEKQTYNCSDTIGLMSKGNQKVFNDTTKSKYQTMVCRNWSDLTPYASEGECKTHRDLLKLVGKTIYFYGGNIGYNQDMENLMRLVRKMKPHKDAHFLFVGQGDEVDLILDLANKWNLDNFTYLPSVDQMEFKRLLTEIDVGLFSLSSLHTSHNFPGKLLGYMVESIPILGSINPNNDLTEIINENKSGLITINGEDDLLYKNALALLHDREFRKKLGDNANRLLKDEFSVQTVGDQILASINFSG